MKRIKFFLKNSQTFRLATCLLIIATVMVTLCVVLVERSNRIIKEETEAYLTELSWQVSYKVNQRMEFNLTILREISYNLASLNHEPELKQRYLQNALKTYPFLWFGFVDQNGILTVDEQEPINVSHFPIIQEALQGRPGVSRSIFPIFGNKKGAMYTVPYYEGKEITGAMVGWVPPDDMQLLLDTDTFDGIGFSHIISSDGDLILASKNKHNLLENDNIFEGFTNYAVIHGDDTVEQLKANIAAGKSGNLHFSLPDSANRIMHYVPLNYGNWYLISIVPQEAYGKSISGFTTFSIFMCASIFLLFMVLIMIMLLTTGRKNQQISRIAYIDPVTDGYTTAKFEIAINRKLKSFYPFSFIALNIRRFKLINESFGCQEGNRVLKHIHDGMQRQLQQGEYIARISADVFNMVLDSTDKNEIISRLENMTEAINDYNKTLEIPYYLSVDCGVYVVNSPGMDIFNIRDRANAARKSTKNKEHYLCACAFYNDIERLQLQKEKEMENAMERALQNGEFIVHLQPKIDLQSRQTAGAEALVRWNTPDKGLLPPMDFIPFFEKNGFIRKLDLFVFEEVCKLLRSWLDRGLEPFPISFNLSRNHLTLPFFWKEFQSIQKKYQIPPALLEMELTETLVFENLDKLKSIIHHIHAIGFQCSMDDFGSGYSSLNVLKEIPVDILKLDRLFFSQQNTIRGNDIIEAVIALAKKLGTVTVAEGIETMQQVEFLEKIGCDIVQGFVFSKPLPIDEFEKTIFHKTLGEQ